MPDLNAVGVGAGAGAASDPVRSLLGPTPYRQYVYAYPHKTAYRRLDPPVDLRAAWQAEKRDSLFLYWHIPFCAARCGFCNLFSRTGPVAPEMLDAYLEALNRQAAVIAELLAPFRIARMAVGGGTPTLLAPAQLDRLFQWAATRFGAAGVPVSVEASPETATPDRLAVLRDHGVSRLSLGVESFDPAERQGLGRFDRGDPDQALAAIGAAGFPTVSIDLIYGGPGQTGDTWAASLARAVAWQAEEIYLYPLYVRPLTGLERRGAWDDRRLAAYAQGRDYLTAQGYCQVSMRLFRRAGLGETGAEGGLAYACQSDGMVGLGSGARSYVGSLHHSGPFAVKQPAVAAIVGDFIAQPAADFAGAAHGIRLTEPERARRWLLLMLLQTEGFAPAAYQAAFGRPVLEDAPALAALAAAGLVEVTAERIAPTSLGLAWSDALGPYLFDPRIARLMEGHAWR